MDLSIPSGTIASSFDAAKTLIASAGSRSLTEDEKLQLFAAGLNLALNAPAVIQHFAVSYNPLDRCELSLRYAGGGLRLGARRQLLDQDVDGADLSVGLAVAHVSHDFPIDRVLDGMRLQGLARWDLDVPVLVGWHGDFHRIWAGPRVAFMHHSTDILLRTAGNGGAPSHDDAATASGGGALWGVVAGAALGYRFVFVAIELTVARLAGSAELNVFGRTTTADTSSWIVSPGFALMGEF